MPRQSTIRKNKSYAGSRADEGQSPTILTQNNRVHVDGFRPPRPSQTSRQFASALDNLTDALSIGSSGLFKDMKEEKERKGAIAGALGIGVDEVPDEPESPMAQAREKMRGKGATVQFKSLLDRYFKENRDKDPATYQAGLEQIKRDFLKGKNRSFIEGFLNDGIIYETRANKEFVDYKDEQDTIAFKQELASMAQAELLSLNENPLFKDDPALIAEHMHSFVRNSQALGRTYKNLGRDDINAEVIDTVGILAVNSGRPDLLNFAFLKDENGIALWDTANKGKIAKFVKQAKSTDAANEKAVQEQAKLQRKEASAEAGRFMVDAIYSKRSEQTEDRP